MSAKLINKGVALPYIPGSDVEKGTIVKIGSVIGVVNQKILANTLDDYEEGTFNVGFSFGGGSTGIVYSNQAFNYIKIGKKVFIKGQVVLSAKGILDVSQANK